MLQNERILIAGAATSALTVAFETLREAAGAEYFAIVGYDMEAAHYIAEASCYREYVWSLADSARANNLNVTAAAMAKARIPEILQQGLEHLKLNYAYRFDSKTKSRWQGLFDDARVMSIFAGTSETMRELAGQRLSAQAKRGANRSVE